MIPDMMKHVSEWTEESIKHFMHSKQITYKSYVTSDYKVSFTSRKRENPDERVFWVLAPVTKDYKSENDSDLESEYDMWPAEKWTEMHRWDLVYVVMQPTKYERMFVGKSPVNDMTIFDGRSGTTENGNTMLFDIGKDNYMYIGRDEMLTFVARDPIKLYVSPVGRGGYSYPYAADIRNHIYLIECKVKVLHFAEYVDKMKINTLKDKGLWADKWALDDTRTWQKAWDKWDKKQRKTVDRKKDPFYYCPYQCYYTSDGMNKAEDMIYA